MSSSLVSDAAPAPSPNGSAGRHSAPRRRRSPYLMVAAALAIALVVPTAVFLFGGAEQNDRAPEKGDRAPAFAGHTLAGTPLASTRFAGHPLVIHFCAAWSPDCGNDLGFLAEARATGAGRRVAFLEVMAGAQGTASPQDFYRRAHVTWPVLDDRDQRVAKAFGVGAVPQTFFVGADGIVTARNAGGLAPPTLAGQLERLASE